MYLTVPDIGMTAKRFPVRHSKIYDNYKCWVSTKTATKIQNTKSLRTREFVEDNGIRVVGFVVGVFFRSVVWFDCVVFKCSDRAYYKEVRGKWHFITIPLAISSSSPPPYLQKSRDGERTEVWGRSAECCIAMWVVRPEGRASAAFVYPTSSLLILEASGR